MSNQAKVLVLDIETSPLVVFVWGIRDQYIGLEQIKEDWNIMAWSAKWLGEKEVFYRDRRHSKSDKNILKDLWKLLNEADIVLTQNGVNFDSKRINARLMLNSIKPPKPYRHIDTYLIAKKVAGFTSNKLAYLTDKFCKKHKKTQHKKFPGWLLWTECVKGNIKAWEEMKDYNIADVLGTEDLYNYFRAWAPDYMPNVYPFTKDSTHCGTCGYLGQMVEGRPRHTRIYAYKQNQCPKCGSWQKGEKVKNK